MCDRPRKPSDGPTTHGLYHHPHPLSLRPDFTTSSKQRPREGEREREKRPFLSSTDAPPLAFFRKSTPLYPKHSLKMGLQGQLTDVSSDSFFLILLSLIAAFVNHLRSLLPGLLSSPAARLDDASGSSGGLANLILMADQLSLNRFFSYRYRSDASSSDCVVCLCGLKDGEDVRRLECHHVFHKKCFDGWLQHLNFSCPLCRSPLVPDATLSNTQRRLSADLFACFSLH